MSEFRTALQALADAVSERHGFPEPEWISTKLAIAHHAAVALLARPEPEPRITREEAENLLDEYRLATEIMGNGVGFSSASREALIKMRNEARAACLEAMLRPESGAAEKVRPEPESTPCWVHPAPDAAAPMSPGKTFTAVVTYTGMPAVRPPAASDGEKA